VARGKKSVYSELVEEAYICCDAYDFRWDKKRYLPEFREMWKEGYSVYEMARYFKRKPEEVLFLIVDQYDMKAIQRRPGGIWGDGR